MRLTLGLTLAFVSLYGQSGSPPQFEAASIKPAVPGRLVLHGPESGGPGTTDPGQMTYIGMSLRDLVFRAYDALPYQLSVPSWMEDAERFDIFAKVPAGANKADIPLMLQSLLEERFHLKVRHESRDAPAYALTLGKNGSLIKEYPALLPADFIEAARVSGVDRDGVSIVAPGYAALMMGSQNGLTTISMARLPVRDLCKFLSRVVQQPIVDQTALTGRYDARLHFATYQASLSAPSTSSGETADPAPTLFEALQKQLGLKLERKRLPVDFVVVGHAQRMPTDN